MENLIYLLIIPIIRFLININNYWYLRKALIKRRQYLEGHSSNKDEKKERKARKAEDWIQDNQIEVKKRVLNTGVQDQNETYMEPVGLGYVKERNLSALDNLLFLNKNILKKSEELLKRAKGHYKIQALSSFNPIFWIELVVFMPKELFKVIGFETKAKNIQNTIQILYWIIAIF